mmetsp:Transcript_2927/g.6892  ORF Transcript_2927/g.6892 Transcript_2927/m.6892 type:complete len:113 (+) Transcript_2927:373-711(+)
MTVIPALGNLVDISKLKAQVHAYLAAAADFVLSNVDVEIYSEGILLWWRRNADKISEWAKAARIVFAITPNSASVERVFAKLRNMFGEDQMHSLSDCLRAALMLSYNKRELG